VHEFFATHYPDLPIVERASDGSRRALVVRKHGAPRASDSEPSGYELALDELIDLYRINAVPVDLATL
jgi:hypothetical protein